MLLETPLTQWPALTAMAQRSSASTKCGNVWEVARRQVKRQRGSKDDHKT